MRRLTGFKKSLKCLHPQPSHSRGAAEIIITGISAAAVFNRLTEKERREEERAKAKAEADEGEKNHA